MMYFGVGLFGYVLWDSSVLPGLVYFFDQIKEVFFHYFFQISFQFLTLPLLLLVSL